MPVIRTIAKYLALAAATAGALVFAASMAHASYVRYSPARILRHPQLSQADFQYSISPLSYTLIPPSVTMGPVYDVYATTTQTGSDVTTCVPHATSTLGAVTYRSDNEEVATTTSDGSVQYVSDGTFGLIASSGARTRSLQCQISATTNYVSLAYTGSLVEGSFAKIMYDSVHALVDGKTPTGTSSPATTTMAEYSTYDDGTHTYIRNPNFFAKDVDLTMVPVNINDQGVGRGFLIAPDTALGGAHAGVCVRSGVYHFVDRNSVTYTATIGTTTDVTPDGLCVVHFTAPVSSNIAYAKILPGDFFPCRVSIWAQAFRPVPVIFTGRMIAWHVGAINGGGATSVNTWNLTGGQTNIDPAWWTNQVNGDSGNPVMAVINGHAVGMGMYLSFGVAVSPSAYITTINSIMAAQGSPYQVGVLDETGMPNYCN